MGEELFETRSSGEFEERNQEKGASSGGGRQARRLILQGRYDNEMKHHSKRCRGLMVKQGRNGWSRNLRFMWVCFSR